MSGGSAGSAMGAGQEDFPGSWPAARRVAQGVLRRGRSAAVIWRSLAVVDRGPQGV